MRLAVLAASALVFVDPQARADPTAAPLEGVLHLADTIHAEAPNLSLRAISTAITAYQAAKRRHLTDKPLVTIVDYSVPSAKKRLAVVEVPTGKVLFYTYVAHGKGSGLDFATHFSNVPGTDTSSLGVYLTGETYYGDHGYALRLQGLDPGFNSAAYRRAIVIHSASYVSESFARNHGRMGRSWGCFALGGDVERAIVRLIRGRTILVGYYPDAQWLRSSAFLASTGRESAAAVRTSLTTP